MTLPARASKDVRAPLLLRVFPSELEVGSLDEALGLREPTEWVVEACALPPEAAAALARSSRLAAEAELRSGAGDRVSQDVRHESAAALEEELARRRTELWRVGLRAASVAADRGSAERARGKLLRALAAAGIRAGIPYLEEREALAPSALSFAEPRPPGYWQTFPSDVLPALVPLDDPTVAEPGGVLLGLTLDDAAPVLVDRWREGSHSWAMFGTTGAGKTYAAALHLLRSRWHEPALRSIVLDPLGEFAPWVKRLGGEVIALGASGDGRRLNALDPWTAGGDAQEKVARVGAMFRALHPSLTDEEETALDTHLTALLTDRARGDTAPVWSDLVAAVEADRSAPPRLLGLLEPFRRGSLRHLDGPTTVRTDARLLGVDFRGVPENHLGLYLALVLDWAYGLLRSEPGPKIVVVDEAHLLSRVPAVAQFFDRAVRHVRHYTAGFLLLSQSPDDFLETAAGRSVLENLRATLLFRLPKVSAAARAFFGLTSPEETWLASARLPREAGYAEALLRSGMLHVPLAVVATAAEHALLRDTLGICRSAKGAARPAGGLSTVRANDSVDGGSG